MFFLVRSTVATKSICRVKMSKMLANEQAHKTVESSNPVGTGRNFGASREDAESGVLCVSNVKKRVSGRVSGVVRHFR